MPKPKKNPVGRPPNPKPEPVKRKVGRPTDYDTTWHPKRARRWAWLGYTNEEIYFAFAISCDTFYKWMDRYSEFAEAIWAGRNEDMADLTNSLTRRAKGYKVKEVKKLIVPAHTKLVESFEPDPEYPDDPAKMKLVSKLVDVPDTVVEVTETIKEVPADVNALKYIHNNRDSKRWREAAHIDHTTNGKDMGASKLDLSLLDDKDIEEMARIEAKARGGRTDGE